MKYRRLNLSELKMVEKEFVQFLASNHITADDWVQLKQSDTQKVERLLDLFSAIVWDKTLPTIKYLEFTQKYDCKTFFFDQNHVQLYGISINKNIGVDLQQINLLTDLPDLLNQFEGQMKIYEMQKKYQKSKESEIYDLLEGGCLISKNGHLYQLLEAISQQNG